jgi:hypothetical protein
VRWLATLKPYRTEPRRPADALQLTLRFSFQARLTPGVDMTSEVKRWLVSFSMGFLLSYRVIGRAGARKMRRLILLIFVG